MQSRVSRLIQNTTFFYTPVDATGATSQQTVENVKYTWKYQVQRKPNCAIFHKDSSARNFSLYVHTNYYAPP